ncbi:unnamed protein product [Orchesella dallaii]|uniref:BTB domain-containing protein n=1 Tax=Orchesella dallaii TaxID=48710 RepID=A0ABP1QMA9_9HEXA
MAQSTENTFNFSWGSQQSYILNGLKTLAVGDRNNVFLTDVTLACEGHYIEAHRLVLSLCSSFFKDLFNQNEKISDKAHGIVILSHVSAVNLRYILQFMYQGSVRIPQEHVKGFLQTGSMLKVEGLTGATGVAVGLPDKVSSVSTPFTSSSSSGKPFLKSNQPSPSFKPMKRRRISGSGGSVGGSGDEDGGRRHSTRSRVKVSVKPNRSPQGATSTVLGDDDNDDTGNPIDSDVILDDCGDVGGDSDFGEAAMADGVGVSSDKVEGAAAALNLPEPSTKQEGQKTATPKLGESAVSGGGRGRKNNSSSSSSSSDDDDDSSSDSSDSIVDYVDLRLRKTPRKLNYELKKSFQNLDEAKAYVKSLNSWTPNYTRTSLTNETRHNFLCRFIKSCPARLHLLEHGTTIDLYLSTMEHCHPPIVRKRLGMSEEVKAKVNYLYGKGMTGPVPLQKALKTAGLGEVTIPQLNGYVQRIRQRLSKMERKVDEGSSSVKPVEVEVEKPPK